ncbi:MAG: hypothetical protein AB1346_00170 [Thermodesulfobacteriota bacterium]
MGDRVQVFVNGKPETLYRGMRVRHALIARDQALYDAAERGELRVEDGNGFSLDLDGGLTDGMKILTRPAG